LLPIELKALKSKVAYIIIKKYNKL